MTQFHLPADPISWSYLGPEADDDFHDPDYRGTRSSRIINAVFTLRGVANVGCLILLFFLMLLMFAGYPILSYYLTPYQDTDGGYNLGGINATGQVASFGHFALIDPDTPQSAYTHNSLETGDQWELVFSDEFNVDGRTFYDGEPPLSNSRTNMRRRPADELLGDDPYWGGCGLALLANEQPGVV